ncbi:peptidoglycan-binding domain-containing protein [Streptomyces sp. DSM 44917]|uniref:Peptidoglycan-binding domain-containing protein n=1 Tax=Streptomyces boetiae TaxID=3075541 RepID=A0ABU2L1X6_9ACTN|nr:peptidoglycan-binding domain-containing protein [Streptomyces sp. DSM 44917]MDT0305549.1 peptidoglycan-binding domain-containing protein [Streptomyces sp. DSM 44917]
MRARGALAALGAVAVAGAAAVAASGFGGGSAETGGEAPDGPPATAEVTTATLTRTEEVTGTLSHGDPVTVQAPAPDAPDGPGMLTWLPDPGDTVSRGEPLYTVNAQPVPLLYGAQPLYRPLEPGVEGPDVELLEENLAALGYEGFTADATYSQGTAEAVAAWQEDLGRPGTGAVLPGEAAVAGGAARVQALHAAPGAPASGPVLDITGTERRIDVALEAGLEDLAAEGTAATVGLPDGTELEAEVTHVGAATAAPGGEADPEAEVTIPLELSVADQDALGTYQAAPVTVRLTAERREDVLAVPVNALVALREGGYGVEVAEGGGTAYVRVETGLFADGLVEVSGEGIAEGTVVGVPE